MKFFKVFLILLVIFAGACKSTSPSIELDTSASAQTIEHKGTAFGITSIPPWLSAYLLGNGVRGIEALPEYENVYVYVGEDNGPALQQVLTWANNFNVQQQIATTINTSVASVFKAHENLVPNNPDAIRKYDNALNTLVQASYSGARKEDDWWVHTRIVEGRRTIDERYTAYVLVTIERRFLDEQIRNQINRLRDESPELGEFFEAVTMQLLQRGLQWD